MFWLLFVVSILMFLLLLILFTKLTININYYRQNDDDDLKIVFKVLFGLIKYKIAVPLMKIDDNSPSIIVKNHTQMGNSSGGVAPPPKETVDKIKLDDILTYVKNGKELLDHVMGMHVIIRKFFRKVTLKKFEWETMVGVGDAAHTGMVTGALWTIKGGILGLLSHYFKVKEVPKLAVNPHFQCAIIQTGLTCIFQFRIGHAMLAGLKLFKFWKGGRPHFKSKTDILKEKTKSV
ncbi:MAG: DUF2953 domain-containing protein [Bacillus sp. (in: Bacteria)]|nr:DUF2953 domain-containing protein [Bacillus sp. (in: firmicutes)]